MSRLTLFAPFFFGLLLAVTGVLGMTGRSPKNDWFGIRVHVVMSTTLPGSPATGPAALGCSPAGSGLSPPA